MKLKVGIIGLGVGEKHIYEYKKHPNCEIIALCDFDRNKVNKARFNYPDIEICENSKEIINNDMIDIVSIASYDSFHYEQIVGAINNEKHVFVEKPMCLYKNEAEKIKKILNNKSEIKLSSNLNLRTTPRFKRLKNMVNENHLGDLFYVESDYNSGRIKKVTEGWRGNENFHSVVYSSAIHVVDLICWILDDLPYEVTGYGNKIATKNTKFKFNDFVVGIMRYKNNIISKVTANIGCVHPHFHNLTVYGTKSTFINRFNEAIVIESRDNEKKPKVMKESYPGGKKGEIISSFVDSI